MVLEGLTEEEKKEYYAIEDREKYSDCYLICPKCGYEYEDDGSYRKEGSGKETCDECNTEFQFEIDYTIHYSTYLQSDRDRSHELIRISSKRIQESVGD